MNTLRIAICEDEKKDAERLASLISKSGVAAEVTNFESGESFLAFHPAGRFDLVFFDINMIGLSGVEAARALREADDACAVVFTTNSPDHMPEAFDVGASQYLIKPLQYEKLGKVLKKCLDMKELSQKTCLIKTKSGHVNVPLDHIYYVEVIDHNCLAHTANGVIETDYMTMRDFEDLLPPPRFLRCYKSYIVNLSYVEKIDREFRVFIMKNGHKVYIRRDDVAKCAHELDRWHLAEARRDLV